MKILLGEMHVEIGSLAELAALVKALDEFIGSAYFLRVEAETEGGHPVLKITKEPV